MILAVAADGTKVVKFGIESVQFAQFLNGCSVACCYFRKGITILDGYTLAALFPVSASLAALLAA